MKQIRLLFCASKKSDVAATDMLPKTTNKQILLTPHTNYCEVISCYYKTLTKKRHTYLQQHNMLKKRRHHTKTKNIKQPTPLTDSDCLNPAYTQGDYAIIGDALYNNNADTFGHI